MQSLLCAIFISWGHLIFGIYFGLDSSLSAKDKEEKGKLLLLPFVLILDSTNSLMLGRSSGLIPNTDLVRGCPLGESGQTAL